MRPHTGGKHRRRRQRQLPLPAIAGSVTVAVAVAGAVTVPTAGASIDSQNLDVLALDAPTRPVAAGEGEPGADVFAAVSASGESLTTAVQQASATAHQTIVAAEVERARREAEERAAREAEERARLAAMYVAPLDSYQLSARYGTGGGRWARGYHTGLDMTAPYGTPVKAVHSGTVTFAGWDGAYGQKVEITHEDGSQTWYAHMSSIAVTSGAVTTGQQIGAVGSTGNSSGNHLHLEVHVGDADTDPHSWLANKGLVL